jgi:hypothetical protein
LLYFQLLLSLFNLSLLGELFSEHIIEDCCSGSETCHFAPRQQRQPDQYYTSPDKAMRRISYYKADKEQCYEQQVIENAMRSRRVDRAAQFVNLSVYLSASLRYIIVIAAYRCHARGSI